MFSHYVKKWHLTPAGDPMITHSSKLLPVRFDGKAAMLKIAISADEKRGGLLMVWWQGDGAARVFACDDNAILIERAEGACSLQQMSHNGYDNKACRIICRCVANLHKARNKPLPQLTPLKQWFQDLEPAAQKYGGILKISAAIAAELLNHPQDINVLHGDIHHNNILDFGERGWLAVDPKGLIGDRGFDYANIFCNPDKEIAANPYLFRQRLEVISEMANLTPERLLKWIVAWCGLSAAWFLKDNHHPGAGIGFTIAELALKQPELSLISRFNLQ